MFYIKRRLSRQQKRPFFEVQNISLLNHNFGQKFLKFFLYVVLKKKGQKKMIVINKKDAYLVYKKAIFQKDKIVFFKGITRSP